MDRPKDGIIKGGERCQKLPICAKNATAVSRKRVRVSIVDVNQPTACVLGISAAVV